MKTLAGIGLAALLVTGAFAQHRVSGYGSASGFGNVVFPGTGRPPVAGSQFSITNPGFPSRLGATVAGTNVLNQRPGGRRPVVYVPYAYPVYTGYGLGYGAYEQPPAPQAPPVVIQNAQPPAPPVVINQYFGSDAAPAPSNGSAGVRVYEAPSRSLAEVPVTDKYYLIAMKDHSIYSAFAYWVEGETLHYVTTQGVHNQASLDLVDQDFTKQLNKDRNVDIRLGAARN